jgi:hypothetical protein
MWSIHSVVVHKPISLRVAQEHAKHILKNNKGYKLRDDNQSFRFSKDKTLFKKFRTQVINPKISIIWGLLK